MNLLDKKICRTCKACRPLWEFHAGGRSRNGNPTRALDCRFCVSEKLRGKRKFKRGRKHYTNKNRNCHAKLESLVARKLIEKPNKCSKCKKTFPKNKIHGHHHNGYSNTLDVIWICFWCHTRQQLLASRKCRIRPPARD